MSETVFRFHKHGNYTTIDNRTIRDPELSLKGLGLLTKMISLPPDWSFSFNNKTCYYIKIKCRNLKIG